MCQKSVRETLEAEAAALEAAGYTTWHKALGTFYRGMWHCLVKGGSLHGLRPLVATTQARLQIYWLALSLRLWSEPHYRSGTFHNDMLKNLRNVAVPKTGVPLSLVCCSRVVAYPFVLFIYPALCLVAALVRCWRDGFPISRGFAEQLLHPTDWFTFWRLNCVLASYHALQKGEGGYEMEDKLTFLEVCEREGIAASPWLKVPKLVCKHRNEEGGLGFAVFSNATAGGDWIIQKALDNSAEIAALLPADAPLSTLRLVTSSRACLKEQPAQQAEAADIAVMSACWRAGALRRREHRAQEVQCVAAGLA